MAPEYEWVGDSTNEEFSTTSNELEKAIELNKDEWKEDIDIDTWGTDNWIGVKMAPRAEDAENNSDISGDRNILHDDPETVEEASEEFDFVREPEQEGDVVISQGMSYMDAIADEFEQPLKSVGGTWLEMVYAPEDRAETPDKVVLSNNGTEDYIATLFPEGKTDEAIHAGKISPVYADEPGDFHPEHNSYLTALADQAVGRSFETRDDIRNGELLISNDIRAEKPVDWERAKEFRFEREEVKEVDEEGHQVQTEWSITVEYEDGTEEDSLSYTETSMYADGFEELDAVEDFYEESICQSAFDTAEAYRDAVNSATAATTHAALTPGRLTTEAAMEGAKMWTGMLTGSGKSYRTAD